jgi:transposase
MGLFPPSPGGGEAVSHGYKGKGSLIHLLVDGNGQPIAVTTTSANQDERLEVSKLLEKIPLLNRKSLKERIIVLEADKGYDCDWLRNLLFSRGIFPFIPFRKIKGREAPTTEEMMKTFHLERNRWKVERAFAWVKRRCRRLLMRWERKVMVWNGFVVLGLVYSWVNILVG